MKKILVSAIASLFVINSDGMNVEQDINNSNAKITHCESQNIYQNKEDTDGFLKLFEDWLNGVDHLVLSTSEIWNSEDNADLQNWYRDLQTSFSELIREMPRDSFVNDQAYEKYLNFYNKNNNKDVNAVRYRYISSLLRISISQNLLTEDAYNSIKDKTRQIAQLFGNGCSIFDKSNFMNKLFPEVDNAALISFLNQKGIPISKIRTFDFSRVRYPDKAQIPADIALELNQNFCGNYPTNAIPNDISFTCASDKEFSDIDYDQYRICVSQQNLDYVGIQNNSMCAVTSDRFSRVYHELNHAIAHPLTIFYQIFDYLKHSKFMYDSLDLLLKMVNISSKSATLNIENKNLTSELSNNILEVFTNINLSMVRDELLYPKANVIAEILQIEGFFICGDELFYYPWNDKIVDILRQQPLRFGYCVFFKLSVEEYLNIDFEKSLNACSYFFLNIIYVKPNHQIIKRVLDNLSYKELLIEAESHPEKFVKFPDDYVTVDEQFFRLLNNQSAYKAIKEEDKIEQAENHSSND